MTKKNTLNKEQEKRFDKVFDMAMSLSDFPTELVKQFLVDELSKQKEEIIEELEKMKMPISQADKDLAKGTEESGIFRVFLNEAIN